MGDVGHREAQLGSFEIQTEKYSGPLELLLELIEKRKLLINDISLAAVTDDYMRHVAIMEQNPLREIAQFVVLASTLLLIKSKSLLPILDLTPSEEESALNLQRRLKHYQIFRNAGKTIERIFGVRVAHERKFVSSVGSLFIPDTYTEVTALEQAITEIIAKLPKRPPKPKIRVQKTISLEEMIERLKMRIERQITLKFKEFAGVGKEKTTVIVGFLAVLEMVKQGRIIVRQTTRYEDIEIEREGSDAPRYI